jgi:hypothetical protein
MMKESKVVLTQCPLSIKKFLLPLVTDGEPALITKRGSAVYQENQYGAFYTKCCNSKYSENDTIYAIMEFRIPIIPL